MNNREYLHEIIKNRLISYEEEYMDLKERIIQYQEMNNPQEAYNDSEYKKAVCRMLELQGIINNLISSFDFPADFLLWAWAGDSHFCVLNDVVIEDVRYIGDDEDIQRTYKDEDHEFDLEECKTCEDYDTCLKRYLREEIANRFYNKDYTQDQPPKSKSSKTKSSKAKSSKAKSQDKKKEIPQPSVNNKNKLKNIGDKNNKTDYNDDSINSFKNHTFIDLNDCPPNISKEDFINFMNKLFE